MLFIEKLIDHWPDHADQHVASLRRSWNGSIAPIINNWFYLDCRMYKPRSINPKVTFKKSKTTFTSLVDCQPSSIYPQPTMNAKMQQIVIVKITSIILECWPINNTTSFLIALIIYSAMIVSVIFIAIVRPRHYKKNISVYYQIVVVGTMRLETDSRVLKILQLCHSVASKSNDFSIILDHWFSNETFEFQWFFIAP